MTVIAGLAQSRCGTDPEPISDTPSSSPDCARTRSCGIVDVGGGRLVQTLDRDIAVVVVQRRQQPHQHAQRVGHHTTPQTRVQAVVQRRDLHHAVGKPAQRHRQRGHVGAPVVRVGDDDDVGGQRFLVGGQQSAQRRRAGLLLAFDEHRHTDRRLATVCRNAARCVAMPALSSALPRPYRRPSRSVGSKRRRHPLVVVALGLHIVMGIQQHRRRARWRRMPGDDGRCAALADDLHIAEPGLRQQLCHCLGASLHLTPARRVRPHRLDAHQVFQVPPHRRQHVTHPLHQIAHGTRLALSAPPARRPPRRCPPRGSATGGSSPSPGAQRSRRSAGPGVDPTCP